MQANKTGREERLGVVPYDPTTSVVGKKSQTRKYRRNKMRYKRDKFLFYQPSVAMSQ